MIIGNGLLGSAFIEFDLPEVVFFASGVSNSSEISIDMPQNKKILK